MPTYYVQPNGNNSWSGTSPTYVGGTTGPWQTISKALGASGITSGDTVYLAPGNYAESVTVGMSSAATTTYVIGDPTASMFSGITAGQVRWTSYNSIGTTVEHNNNSLLLCSSKNYLSFQNILFESKLLGIATCDFDTCTNWAFKNCVFETSSNHPIIRYTTPSSTAANFSVENCIFHIATYGITGTGGNVADSTSITNSLFMNSRLGLGNTTLQMNVFNCSFIGIRSSAGISNTGGSASFLSTVTNCLFWGCLYGIYSDISNRVTQTYNRFIGNSVNLNAVATSATSTTTFSHGLILPYQLQTGLGTFQMFSSILGGPNTAAGIATGAPASDMYGVTWTGATPDTGSATYRSLSGIGQYNPTERNASTITIAPASTSQSIELYLGATGLTASTSGLTARYNRTRTASVSIPLVARTIAQAWTSGGFAEVDAVEMPGVYRLDIPNEALVGGADDVTVVVRGASGTNGAVMTIKLSSGGLTGAQTASAVWGADPSPYTTATDFGGVLNETRNVVGNIETLVQNLPQDVWDEPKSGHATAGTFGAKLQDNVLADELLAREIGSTSGAGLINERTVRSALRGLRNKTTVINNEMTVYKEDDTSTAWSATVSSSDSSKTITGVDPA
jgi:hypothetical protein